LAVRSKQKPRRGKRRVGRFCLQINVRHVLTPNEIVASAPDKVIASAPQQAIAGWAAAEPLKRKTIANGQAVHWREARGDVQSTRNR